MKYFVIAGEASGDLHGSNLLKSIYNLDSNADFRFWGGDEMKKVSGIEPLKHITELAFMGFIEVIRNLPAIIGNFKSCKIQIQNFEPDVLVLIDYPGFNLRMAKWAKKTGYKVVYYISPQIWAWKENRVRTIKKYVDEMICILPFEVDFYKKHGIEAHYVGHPLLDAIELNEIKNNRSQSIGLLPGSRKQEISKILPVMLHVAKRFKDYSFTIAGVPSIDQEYYKSFALPDNVALAFNQTQNIMRTSKAALVTSGTATLETALFETPLIVCFKASALSVAIARMLIKVKFISLVNLIADRELVKELIQSEFTEDNCIRELERILKPEVQEEMKKEFKHLKTLLGNQGASQKAAQIIVNL